MALSHKKLAQKRARKNQKRKGKGYTPVQPEVKLIQSAKTPAADTLVL